MARSDRITVRNRIGATNPYVGEGKVSQIHGTRREVQKGYTTRNDIR